jgi:signal transduction histidine kinase
LPRSRLPFLLALLTVAIALSAVAIAQMRRDAELSRLRADFVASISHELRTPLAQMRLYLETQRLGRFKTDAEREWSMGNVERETVRLQHLVERVLRFSRTGRPDYDLAEAVDSRAEVEEIVSEFAPLASSRGCRIVLEAEDVPQVMLQPGALRHLVLNLLDNAVKYGPANQVVSVLVRRVKDTVQVEVIDQGAGISSPDRESIWRPYERGSSAAHVAGSGIGLSIVREVARQHGGDAWIAEPASNEGAHFVISLPVSNVAPEPAVTSLAGTPPQLVVRS